MNNVDKVARLQQLTEAALRRQVVIPLLGRLGYKAATEYHGPREHGKDIVCFETHKLGARKYLAIVAKVGDLTGSVSSSSGLSEVLNQVEQCFNEKYTDLFGMQTVTMDEVWVVTTGRIVSGAADSVTGRLEKHNLSKLVRFVSGAELVHLLDQHYTSYWSEEGETIERVRAQRDRLDRFLRDLLKRLGATESQVNEVATQLHHSTWSPAVYDVKAMRVHRSSTYELVVGPSQYVKGLVSDQCGDIAEALKEVQDKVRSALYDVEENLETAHKAIAQTDPWEFIGLFEQIEDEHPFSRDTRGGGEAVSASNALLDGLRELDEFLEALGAIGKLDYFLAVVASLESRREEIEQYLGHVDTASFTLNWSVGDVRDPSVRIVYDGPAETGRDMFATTHNRDVRLSYHSERLRRVTASEVLERAQLRLRELIEGKLLPGRQTDL